MKKKLTFEEACDRILSAPENKGITRPLIEIYFEASQLMCHERDREANEKDQEIERLKGVIETLDKLIFPEKGEDGGKTCFPMHMDFGAIADVIKLSKNQTE